MNVMNWLIQTATDLVYTMFWNAVAWALGLALLGLIGGIWLVNRARKRGYLNRTLPLWTTLARLYYLYLPVVLMVTLGLVGTAYGLQRQLNAWIEEVTEPVVAYTLAYLPEIQAMGAHLNQQMTLAEGVHTLVSQEENLPADPWAREFILTYHEALIQGMLTELGYPIEIDGLIRLIREPDYRQIDAEMAKAIPSYLRDFCGQYFATMYGSFLLLMLPFWLVVGGEWGLHWLVSRRRASFPQ